MSIVRTHLVAPLLQATTYRRLAYIASALVAGPVWFALLVTGWALGLGLAVTLLGIPVLAGLSVAARAAARAERSLANALLDADIPSRRAPGWGRSLFRGLRTWLTDGSAWREQAYLLLRFVPGVVVASVVIAVIYAALSAITVPLWYFTFEGPQLGFTTVDTLPKALAMVPLGLILLALCPYLISFAAGGSRAVARVLLTPSPGAERTGPAARPTLNVRRTAVAIHAGVVAGIGVLLTVIWALATPGHYYWPAWPLIALAVPLLIHGLAVVLYPAGTGSPGRARALWMHAGVAAIVNLYLVAVWALSTPGAYFWVIWTILAFTLPVAAHAIWVAVARGDREQMAARIDTLTTTRAGAVDAQAAELRRIERDLHDGAQARLVALAMDLGMARQRLSDAAPETQALVEGAHEQAKQALTELRDLARGIHPAVLTDRGLAAAIQTLAGHSPIPVELHLDTGGRAPAAVEAAGYFVIAEALTNAAKHSGATAVTVDVARRNRTLVIRVADDGAGGADVAGSGLAGLRHRVEALDGTLTVTSPGGGGTVLGVELPCGS